MICNNLLFNSSNWNFPVNISICSPSRSTAFLFCSTGHQPTAKHHRLEVSMSGPLPPNLCTPTRTPSPLLSPTLSSSPWGQPSVPSGLKSPIMSTGSYALPQSLRPLLSHQSNRPPFPCLPHPGPSPQNCGHQSRRVRQPVLMEHGVRATLKAAEDEASRDCCLSSLFFFLCLSLPFLLSGWWLGELSSRDRYTGLCEGETRQV